MRIRGGNQRLDFDALMRDLAVVGGIALVAWIAVGAATVPTGICTVAPTATLRFLAAVAILVFARRAYAEIRDRRWRKLPPDQRFGFGNLHDDPRSNDAALGFEAPAATEASQPQG
jgi:hypothetical protein